MFRVRVALACAVGNARTGSLELHFRPPPVAFLWTDETQTEQRAIGFRRTCEVEGKNSLFILPLESTDFKDLRMYILRCVCVPLVRLCVRGT